MKTCWYCGRRLTPTPKFKHGLTPKKFQFPLTMETRDHVVPVVFTGRCRSKYDQTVPACYGCNITKGALSVEEFRAAMMVRYRMKKLRFAGEEKR